MPDLFYTAAEIADRWKVSTDTVRRLWRSCELRSVKIRGRRRSSLAQILDYEARNVTEPEPKRRRQGKRPAGRSHTGVV